MAILRFFPTFMWQAKLSPTTFSKSRGRRLASSSPRDWNESLLRECYAFREMDDAGRRWSRKNYVAGYTSYSSISDLHRRSSGFEALKAAIDREVERFAKHLEMDLQGRKLEMSAFWINIMGRNAHHSFHLHPLSAISGTYYLQVPKDSGGFKIEDPRIAGFMGSPPRRAGARKENQRYIELMCKPGEVLLFESWLKHEVPANRSDEDRVSISFNYDWV
jgi:uncharacterized protein (TIGR02466 family)